jgi:hypothetical protein
MNKPNFNHIRQCALLLGVFVASGTAAVAQTNAVADNQPDIIINVDETPLTAEQTQQLSEVFGGAEEGNVDGLPMGAVSCFDYYTFGSVETNVSTALPTVVSGTDITFTGTISNRNPYPVVDGSLYVKVFKYRDGPHDGNGPEVVDQFLVLENVVIPAQSEIPVSFAWRVPAFAASGEYAIATFFTEAQRFNLSGLSFTDDIVGNTTPFRVVGENPHRVYFDKQAVQVAGEPHTFASAIPPVGTNQPVEITATVVNETNTAQTALITWTTYVWDAQQQSNRLRVQADQVEVPAGGEQPVTMTVTNNEHPVYLVEGALQWQDTESFINVRFARDSIDRLRINYPGITSFPLAAGAEHNLFSCLHNVGYTEVVEGGQLEVTLSDRDGNVVESLTYNGDVTAQMMAAAKTFTPERNYNYLQLDAQLSQAGEVVESVRLVYDCQVIDPALCLTESAPVEEENDQLPVLLYVLYGVAGLLFLVVAFIVLRDKPRPKPEDSDDQVIT